MTERQRSALAHTAYHEAGHAVAAHSCYLRFKYVTIERGEGSLGHVLFEQWWKRDKGPDINASPAMQRKLLDIAIISLAGAAGAGLYRQRASGFDWRGCHADLEDASEMVSRLAGSDKELRHWMAIAEIKAQAIVRARADAVHALAAALLESKRLSWAEADEVIMRA